MAMLREAQRLKELRPERPWGKIQAAIDPFNARIRKYYEAAGALEEKLTDSDSEFQKSHQAELEAFKSQQAASLFPETILGYLSSDETIGTVKLKDLVSGLLDDPASLDRVVARLNFHEHGMATPKTKEELLLTMEQISEKRSATEYSNASGTLPPDVLNLCRSQNEAAEAAFLTHVYYRYLTAEFTPWDDRIGDLIKKMEEALATLPTDDPLKTRMASEFADFLVN